MNHLILFLLGLVGLWLGAELITRGSLKIALNMGISQSFVGLTILALGTDFPEIMVGITGGIEKRFHGIDASGIILGNIIGSNMAVSALILGLIGLFGAIKVKRQEIWVQGLMVIASTILFWVLIQDGRVSQRDGMIFILFYLLYFVFLKFYQRLALSEKIKNKVRRRRKFSWWSLAQLISGLMLIAGASHLVVSDGTDLAVQLGMSQLMLGIILVGVGTSLPELVVSVNAAMKGANDLSIGNLMGSNIINILLALGGSALITDWNVDHKIISFDLPYLLLTVVIVTLFLLTKQKLERKESLLILGLYVVYVSLKVGGF